MPAYRSFLFAPGNHARKVMKVFDCGADHVILLMPAGDGPDGLRQLAERVAEPLRERFA